MDQNLDLFRSKKDPTKMDLELWDLDNIFGPYLKDRSRYFLDHFGTLVSLTAVDLRSRIS